jgi:histidyl-tRNA synthetase
VYELSLQGYTAESLAQAFQGVTLFKTEDTLKKQIEGYICAGSRYTHLARKLGGLATLFFLPHGVGSSLYVSERLFGVEKKINGSLVGNEGHPRKVRSMMRSFET